MVTDTGKLLLQDTSSNGTIINGVKTHQQTTEIKYGDEILFAGIEKLDWSLIEKPNVHTGMPTPEKLKEENNKGISSPILKSSSLIKIVLAIIGISTLVAFSYTFFHKSEEKPLDPSAIYSQYKNTVALVEVRYYVRVKTAANELFFGLNADCEIAPSMDKSTLQPLKSEGTAFFYDGLGHEQTLAAEVLRQAEGDAGTGGDQRMLGTGFGDLVEVGVAQCIERSQVEPPRP